MKASDIKHPTPNEIFEELQERIIRMFLGAAEDLFVGRKPTYDELVQFADTLFGKEDKQ